MGKWITFEGIGCSGKSTQVVQVADWLRMREMDVVTTREPGGTEVGLELREILKKKRDIKLRGFSELMLFEADRHETIKQVIIPAIKQGKIVISDRGIDGSIAYQGFGRQIGLELISNLTALATEGIEPDLTIFIDISIDTHLERLAARNPNEDDQFDLEAREFQERVRQGFFYASENFPHRVKVINGNRPNTDVFTDIKQIFLASGIVNDRVFTKEKS